MDRVWLSENRVKRILEFAKKIEWMKWSFSCSRVGERREREGMLLKQRVEEGTGLLKQRDEEKRRKMLVGAKERVRKSREKRREEMSEKDKVLRKLAGRINEGRYRERKAIREEGELKGYRGLSKEERDREVEEIENKLVEERVRRKGKGNRGRRKVLQDVRNR